MKIEQFNEHIFYFEVPYMDVFINIYVIKYGDKAILFDAAATDFDVNTYILPALSALNVDEKALSHVFISHNHGDHSGGLALVAKHFPNAKIVSRCKKINASFANALYPEDSQFIADCLKVVTIPGHTADCAAIFDLRTNTLICGDCLQSYGIYGEGLWYGVVEMPKEHFEAIKKLRLLNIENILTAHDYHPVGVISKGKNNVLLRLDTCIGALDRIIAFINQNPSFNDEQIAALANSEDFPKLSPHVVCALREYNNKLNS